MLSVYWHYEGSTLYIKAELHIGGRYNNKTHQLENILHDLVEALQNYQIK